MTLRTALKAIEEQSCKLSTAPFLLKEPLAETVARLTSGLADQMPSPPWKSELSSVDERFRQSLKENNLDDLYPEYWLQAPYVLWYKKPYLASFPEFTQQLQNRATTCHMLKRIIYAYLSDFDENKSNIAQVGQFLITKINQPILISLHGWRDRHNNYQVFSPSHGPSKLADLFFERQIRFKEFLELSGLSGRLLYGGFTRSIYLKVLNICRYSQRQFGFNELERLLQWSVLEKELRYPEY